MSPLLSLICFWRAFITFYAGLFIVIFICFKYVPRVIILFTLYSRFISFVRIVFWCNAIKKPNLTERTTTKKNGKINNRIRWKKKWLWSFIDGCLIFGQPLCVISSIMKKCCWWWWWQLRVWISFVFSTTNGRAQIHQKRKNDTVPRILGLTLQRFQVFIISYSVYGHSINFIVIIVNSDGKILTQLCHHQTARAYRNKTKNWALFWISRNFKRKCDSIRFYSILFNSILLIKQRKMVTIFSQYWSASECRKRW